jgi:hypothetical protein
MKISKLNENIPLEAENRFVSVAQMDNTAWQWPSAVRVQIRGDLLLNLP